MPLFFPSPLPVTLGGTGADLSATGGIGQLLRQSSAGAAVTVSSLAVADFPALNGFTDADPDLADVTPIYDTSVTSNRDSTLAKIGALFCPSTCQGRLTLTTA